MAEWTAVSHVLPPRRDVVAGFSEIDPYFSFVGQELERAEAFPIAATNKLMDALGSAVFEVSGNQRSAAGDRGAYDRCLPTIASAAARHRPALSASARPRLQD